MGDREELTHGSGTLSYRGVLTAGVYAQLRQLAEKLDVHVLSADTRGTAREQLHDLPSRLHILTGSDHDVQKRDLAKQFDLRQVVAFGKGQNDRLLSLQDGELMSKGENLQLQLRATLKVHTRNDDKNENRTSSMGAEA